LHFKRENYLRYVYAFLIVLVYLFLSPWNRELANYFCYFIFFSGLLVIGIPHGALDYLLVKNKNSSLTLFVFRYLFLVGVYYIIWQFMPLIALIIFMIYSSFHFGESEIIESKNKVDSFLAYLKSFLLGLSILFFILFTHREESISIILKLVGNSELNFAEINISSLSFFAAICSFIYIFLHGFLSKSKSYFGLLFLLILGLQVPLILAFAFYFVFQHSSNAWQHLKLGLNLNSKELYFKSSVYTLGALVIFILFFLNANEMAASTKLVSIFFIFIACISFPHIILMHGFYKKQSTIHN
jgi:Brp/Blh family beta-carotene 15,15'-monooxygenase